MKKIKPKTQALKDMKSQGLEYNKSNEITAVQSVKDFIEPILESVHSEYPKIMEVSESPTFDKYVPRVVVKEIDHKYIAWVNAETFEEAEKEWRTIPWSYARDIQGTVELTLEKIAEKNLIYL